MMPKTLFSRKTLIFSKLIEKIYMKMVTINIKYETTMKTSYYFIDLLLVFQY